MAKRGIDYLKMDQDQIDEIKIELINVKNMVLDHLKQDQRYRDSARDFIVTFYARFYDVYAIAELFQKGVPSIRSVIRWRAKIQNEYGLYKPSEEVQETKDIREVAHRQVLKGQ